MSTIRSAMSYARPTYHQATSTFGPWRRFSAEHLRDHGAVAHHLVSGYRLPLAGRGVPLEVGKTYPFETGVPGVRDEPVRVPPARAHIRDRHRQSLAPAVGL